MSTTYLATAPDGSIFKRTSDNRTYTHAVLVMPSHADALARASKLDKQDGENHDFHVEMANGSHRLAGRKSWHTDEQHAEEIANWKLLADEYPNAAAAMIGKRDLRVAAVNALKASGYFDRWEAVTWCGRPDLVSAQLGKYQASGRHASVMAVAVTTKAKKGGAQ